MAVVVVIGEDASESKTPLLNDVVRGSVDLKGLPSRRSESGCWKSASFILCVELAERFAYYGISANLMSYLTGSLGQSTATAAESINAWKGTASLLPLLGAVAADSNWGRYRTIVGASLLYVLGLGFLSLSATFHSSNSSKCKNDPNTLACSPSQFELLFFFLSLYLVALAQGGHKPSVQAFGANQFDEEHEEELKAKSSFFNWWNLCMQAGIVVALLLLSYIQENLSWELGFGIPCIVMCFALIVFLLGSAAYRFRIRNNQRNPFARIGKVFVDAARNWRAIPTNVSSGDTTFRFLDKAILPCDDMNACTVNDIDDSKAILRLAPIWCTCLGYGVVFAQASTLFITQGATMDRTIAYGFQIPAASLQSVICISIIILIPIYDRVLVPRARAMTGKPSGISMLQRIGIGLFISVLLMIVAALVERQRRAIAIEHGLVDEPSETVPMSVWWLAPQFLLLGMGDVFAMVGLQEFFYDQVPDEFKSIGLAFYCCVFGIGSFLSSFLIYVIESMTRDKYNHGSWFSDNLNRAHLDYFYWLLAGMSTVTMLAYIYFAKSYVYRCNVRRTHGSG